MGIVLINGIPTYADKAEGGTLTVVAGTSGAEIDSGLEAVEGVVRFVADGALNIRTGPTGVGAATTAYYRVPANTVVYVPFGYLNAAGAAVTHFRAIADSADTNLQWSVVS